MADNEKKVDETISEEQDKLNQENAEYEAGIVPSLTDTDIVGQVQQSFLDYAMSVIVSRAIPDIRDGFKPVHRRVIYGMYEGGYTSDKPYVKCAKVVGDVMGKYHPHGDASIYDTIVRLAQPFSLRYPIIDGHGNFGNMDGDQAAAYRYTECRMNKLAYEMCKDLNYNTVDFTPNYDGSLQEPTVLPLKFPNLLINGADGIAVGMATKMPSHNLSEVVEGIEAYVKNPDISVEELMKYIKGPDFPTGGIIYGLSGVRDAYTTGRGTFRLRAKAHVETSATGKSKIIITEIPYQVRKGDLVAKIGELARDKVVDGITAIKDYSKIDVHIEIDVRHDVEPNVLLNKLYKLTQLEISYGVINLCIVNGVPKIVGLKELISNFLEFEIEIVERKTKFLIDKDTLRKEIIDGLLKVHDVIDEVIQIAKKAANPQEFGEKIIEKYGFSEDQAKAIVNMTLGRLTGIEVGKLEAERSEIEQRLQKYTEILSSRENKIKEILRDLNEMKEKYKDDRRTEISTSILSIDDEDLIAKDDIVICLTRKGYVKRMSTSEFRTQNRGGVGVKGMAVYNDDEVIKVAFASTHSDILFFSNLGKVYRKRGHEINESSRTSKGLPLVNLLNLDKNESIVSIISIDNTMEDIESKFLFFATKQGIVKKTSITEFERINCNGKNAIKFREDDGLLDVKLTDGHAKILLASDDGQLCMFDESEVRAMGRTAAGVKGMNLEDSKLISLSTSLEGNKVFVIGNKGLGKISPMEDYRETHRGSKGVITIKINEKTGKLVGMAAVKGDEDYLSITSAGQVIRASLSQVRECGRNSSGVTLMNLKDNEFISSFAILPHESEEEVVEEAETTSSETEETAQTEEKEL